MFNSLMVKTLMIRNVCCGDLSILSVKNKINKSRENPWSNAVLLNFYAPYYSHDQTILLNHYN